MRWRLRPCATPESATPGFDCWSGLSEGGAVCGHGSPAQAEFPGQGIIQGSTAMRHGRSVRPTALASARPPTPGGVPSDHTNTVYPWRNTFFP